ncbi:MAG: SIMPL domain-containing protein [archaeon]
MEQKNILITILVIGLVLTSAILAINMRSGETVVTTTTDSQRNTVSVSGNGKVSTQPDKAELYIKVNTEGTTASAARDANSKLAKGVIDALVGQGVKKSDIETNYYYLQKKQEWDENQKKYVDVGYEVNHVMKVTTKDLDNIGKLLDTAISAGANGIDSVSFGLTDEKQKEVSKEALKMASVNAENKAEAIAGSVGVSLGKLVTVSESNFNYIPYVRSVMYDKAVAGAEAPETNILPQTLEVTATVNLVYEIK